ncbi:hypothetical protein HPP92_025759 [Vanilla planifolia]|uniref:Malectin-like domain-containing protein n=1 Tax=Vanilla planifolia TaxID=51239 RepID=A0A835PL69_VANPL|nr:hypothetical protein HPP92_025759 [Vanilla planifolia]
MGNLPNPRHMLIILFFSSVLRSSFSFSSALFSPPDNLLVDCGSSYSTGLNDRRIFLPDFNGDSVRLISDEPSFAVAAKNNLVLEDETYAPLYRTARVFTGSSSYVFRINNKGTHIVRLHFYPFSNSDQDLSSAQFHVVASGFVLLRNFTASSNLSSSVKEFIISVEVDELTISFVPSTFLSLAFVNAIEVISAPADLIRDTGRLVKPNNVETFYGLSNQVLETLFRVNVGGPKVTPFNDTLWRTWSPDNAFFHSNSSTKTVYFSGRIMYQKYGASREVAPDNVYNTARVLGANSSDLISRMTWSFPVNQGYRYLVRMHLCDIASLALNELYFSVYINGYLAYEDFDISAATSHYLASPYYVDFVVNAGSSGILSVSVGPSTFGESSIVNGILNGLEILKINNSVRSFDMELPIAFLVHRSTEGALTAAFRSLICWFAFVLLIVSGFMSIWRWGIQPRNHITWSPLSMNAQESQITKADQF